jgi:2-dehydro-3-deoxygluconokinase
VRATSTDESARGPLDAVTIGETMVAFVSRDDPGRYLAVAAGAESNVAVGMARLGLRARWVSRLGDDPLGRFVEDEIAAAGVDLQVVRDATRPTGVMTVHVDGPERRTAYYRSESAARLLDPGDLRRAGAAAWIHVTGVTAALSPTAAELVEAIVVGRAGGGARVSFDVNHRPILWADTAAAARLLLGFARAADLVFVGSDEAEVLFGTAEAPALAELILRRADQELVLKRGAGPASTLTLRGEVSEPGLRVEIVEVTGAGDAFAAGYLAATVLGWPARARLRLGHLMGSRAVGVLDHVPPPFSAAELADLSPATLAARWEDGASAE